MARWAWASASSKKLRATSGWWGPRVSARLNGLRQWSRPLARALLHHSLCAAPLPAALKASRETWMASGPTRVSTPANAHHYSHSGIAEKAIDYLTRLAKAAGRGHAHAEAVRALEQALGHVDQLPVGERERCRLDLIRREAYSLIPLGRLREILDLLLWHQDGFERLQDPSLLGEPISQVISQTVPWASRGLPASCTAWAALSARWDGSPSARRSSMMQRRRSARQRAPSLRCTPDMR